MLYRSYVFTKKDPAIDELRTVVEDHFGARVTRKHLKEIEESGGPKLGTMANWFFGGTLRPQNPTIEAAGRAIGYRRAWVKMKKNGVTK
jgi:hypothetical protein